MKAKSQLGTVFEEEVYLGKLPQEPGELGNGQAINRLFVAEDTTSLASSIQHRSDESGYESDGTKNGSDESSNSEDKRQPFVIETDVPLVIAKNSISTSLSLRTSVKRTESKENCSLRTCVKRTESKENCSLRTGVKRAESKENCSLRTGVKRAESKENCSLRTSAKRAESKENCSLRIGVKRAESKENCSLRTSVKRAESKENCICSPQKTSDGNLQRFSAILQKLKTQNSGSSSTSRTASSASQNRVHSSSDGRACGDARSLRLRTPGILSQLVLKCKDDRTGKNDTRGSSTKCDPKTETSRLGQFKAWTLDRRLLRKTKKGTHHSDHQKADRLSPKRTSLFESSLCLDTVQESSDVSGPATNHLDHSELGTSEEVDDGGVISKLHLCGDLNYQLKLKKAGHKMSSTNNDTRRQWLQPQLNTKSNPKEKESKGAMFYWGNGPNKDSFTFKLPVADCNLDSDTELREPEKCDNTELVFTTKHSGLENTTKQKVFSVVLEKDEQGELGIYINRQEEERNVVGYVVAALEEGGPACRNGQLQAGDELLTVNGKQLQGVNLEEAQRLLRTFKTTVKLLVSRKVPSNRFCTLSRPSSSQLFTYSVAFEKGPGCKNLGFSIVGGKDSPKGDMGIFVKTVFSTGQAVESGKIMEGDEILMVNGQPLQGMVHSEAIATFRNIKQGTVLLRVGRRTSVGRHGIRHVSKSCSNLDRLS
ncbi:uncharacterized protein LOC143246898 isoform X2 [Tachypleus tridentatus]|uniref:uncharacterized protein LOC143246898 isoform X2 n=1 Tax=Tachypleus tridentatus TaxID=6853 RepID=UPI003FD499C4